jgi:hypothetical protein
MDGEIARLTALTVKNIRNEIAIFNKTRHFKGYSKLRKVDLIKAFAKIIKDDEIRCGSEVETTKSKDKMVTKSDGLSMVYFGAGWDMKFLKASYLRNFKHYILVDALPKLSHYEKGTAGYEKANSEKSFILSIKQSIENIAVIGDYTRKGDHLIFMLNDGRQIDYYINTTVEDALHSKSIRKKLEKVKWVHVKGFHPFSYGLKPAHVPNTFKNLGELYQNLAE